MFLDNPTIIESASKNNFDKHISMVSYNGILVKRLFTSKEVINREPALGIVPRCCTNSAEFLTVYSFIERGFKIGTKNLAKLKEGVFQAEKIGIN